MSGGKTIYRGPLFVAAWLLLLALPGCGTTRMTDTQRTATEQLLISDAVDHAVSQLDFRCLANKAVFLDVQFLEGTVDRGYLVSSIRQHLMACGCAMMEDRTKAEFIVEARAGAVGTDRQSLLIGVPQMTVPAIIPGQPSQIPEIPFAKKTEQNGVAKIAVFAYHRTSGLPVWQSGTLRTQSTAKDLWVLGSGPFQHGSIQPSTKFAGERLPLTPFGEKEAEDDRDVPSVIPVTHPARWPEHESVIPATARGFPQALTAPPSGNRLGIGKVIRSHLEVPGVPPLPLPPPPPPPPPKEPPAPPPLKPLFTTPAPVNTGGHAETEPLQIMQNWHEAKPGT